MSDVPPELAALYASERTATGAPAADRERIRNAVLASVGVTVVAGGATTAGAATTTAATTASSIASKLVVVLVALGAIGGGAALLSRDSSTDVGTRTAKTEPSAPVPRVNSAPSAQLPPTSPTVAQQPFVAVTTQPPVAPPTPSTGRSLPAAQQPLVAATTQPVAPLPAPRTAAAPKASAMSTMPTPVRPTSSAAAESDVQRLARAVALSARGDAAGALALLDGVASTSEVAEERDALRVITFAKLGRIDEACAAVTVFVARYPQSIHRKAVEEVPCSSAR